jgi:hypothetical protein
MKLNTTLAVSAVALVAACGSSVTEQVQIGKPNTTPGGVEVTPTVVYQNGSIVGDWQQGGLSGVSFASNSTVFLNDPGSTQGNSSTSGDLTVIQLTAISAENGINQTGMRYLLALPDGFAASQIRRDIAGPVEQLSSFGATVTSMPTGTITFGGGTDDALFLHLNGQTVQLPFTFTANLANGTATMTSSGGGYELAGGTITINPTTGRFSGTDASIGAVGNLQAANIFGGIYGTNGTGIGGIAFSTDQANPSIVANFVGSR